MLTMFGSLLNSDKIPCPKNTMLKIVTAATMPPSIRQTLSVAVQRSILFAPLFCPTKVVHAWLNELSRL